MYLTRIYLDHTKPNMQSNSVYRLHGYFSHHFEHQPLWRCEADYIIILHEDEHNFSDFEKQFAIEGTVETKSFDNIYNSIEKSKKYFFKLRAHPVKKSQGKEIPLKDSREKIEWLTAQADKYGFRVETMAITDTNVVCFKHREGHKVTLTTMVVEGILCVEDVDTFKKAVVEGLGRKKTFGYGLLSIVPASKCSK